MLMSYFNGMEWKLVAPDIDNLLRGYDRSFLNPSGPVREIENAVSLLRETLIDLAPLGKNENAKSIWLQIPRGTLEDFGTFEEYEDDYIDTPEKFIEFWQEEYPNEYVWYELTFVEEFDKSGDLFYHGISVGNKSILSVLCEDPAREKNPFGEDDWTIALLNLLNEAAKTSMDSLRKGEYNDHLEKELPYKHRLGVIKRSDIWAFYPENKENVLEKISKETLEKLGKLIKSGKNNVEKIGRIYDFRGNDFLKACSIGYKASGYDITDNKTGEELSLTDQYLRFADGRDEGLTGTGHGLNEGPGIDMDDPDAWNDWFFDRNRLGGHPWEVCRGGNSTHVDLYVCHDKNSIEWKMRIDGASDDEIEEASKNWGYYFVVAGKHRNSEAVNFYVSLSEAGYPVVLQNGDAILKKLKGEDLVGIVPWDRHTVYCDELFPAKYGQIISYTHIYPEEYEVLKDCIEWLPLEKAVLQTKEENEADL